MKHHTILLLTLSVSSVSCTQFCQLPSTTLHDPSTIELAMNTAPSLGKTHFIVGHPTHTIPQEQIDAQEAPLPRIVSTSPTPQVLFTPDDKIRDALLQYIHQETERIRIAVYIITDPEITNALINALNRDVGVELITDASCLKERTNKINTLCAHGCSVRIYNPSYDSKNKASLMHHKFALFSNNLGKSLVWTGSYNFTKTAGSTNQENALILEDQNIFDIFAKQFQRLKKRSYRYGQRRKSAHA